MARNFRILCILLILLILSACKKNDPDPETNVVQMKDLNISSGFNWETSRDITFLISSDKSTLINITSEDGGIQYYHGFFNGLASILPVKINIPTAIRQVRVNGIPVTISADEVPVSLSDVLKNGTPFHPQDIPTQGLVAAWHFDENAGTTANDAVAVSYTHLTLPTNREV